VRSQARSVAAKQAPAPEDEWAGMSWEDRHDVMTFTVLPNMARAFQRHDESPAPDTTCRTCHGRYAERIAYAMPSDDLPGFDPAHMPRVDSPDPREARATRFMMEEVTPTMAELLGVPVYDPKTGKGFGCFHCHPTLGAKR
jgi:hypothetical protein